MRAPTRPGCNPAPIADALDRARVGGDRPDSLRPSCSARPAPAPPIHWPLAVGVGHPDAATRTPAGFGPLATGERKDGRVFFVLMNNSTRPLPDSELGPYLANRRPNPPSA